ncbi:MAG TPA: Na+/H+ antiporter NhaC family protein [Cryomorphaceae bacterium]|nr:Na+/H+ antiporter NhaC family protein [Cryomorphaceae bacterium]
MLKKSPDALVIISLVLILFTILTWIIPAGEYAREVVDGRTVVMAGTYETVEASPQGLGDLLVSPIKGFVGAGHIIAFVILVGGAFSILTATGALDAGLGSVLKYAERNPASKHFVVPVLMVIFSLAGCTFGMSEENLVFILITIPLARSMGYDNLVGVAIPFLGSAAGFAGAAINPFTVGIAQGIAELPIGSGAGYRWAVWAVFTIIAIVFVMLYIRKLEKHPEKKLRTDDDQSIYETKEPPVLDLPRKLVLILFVFAIVLLMYGANQLGWYIDEISALFIALGLLSAVVTRMGVTKTVSSFTDGAKDMLTAAIIIGVSRAVLVVAEDGKIIDTVLYAMANGVEELPQTVSVQMMFFVQGALNIFIPSGSGQAAITMPIMTPLADLLGIARQSAVLAFQFGDGLLNVIIPTSGVTMGILSIAKIPYNVWIKWVWKLILVLTLFSMLFLALPQYWDVWP